MMKYNDPRAIKVRELLDKLYDEVKLVNKRSPDVHAGAMRDGMLNYFIPALYTSLPEDSMFIEYFPEALERMIDRIGEEETMHKLES